MHNKKALSGLVLFKTIQNNTEKQKKKENVWRRESWMRNGLVGPGRGVLKLDQDSLVWFSYQIRHQETTADSQNCWEEYLCPPCPTSKIFTSPEWGKRAKKITLDPTYPAHSLLELLASDLCYRAPTTRTARHKNSFLTQAIFSLNNCKTFITIHCPS